MSDQPLTTEERIAAFHRHIRAEAAAIEEAQDRGEDTADRERWWEKTLDEFGRLCQEYYGAEAGR